MRDGTYLAIMEVKYYEHDRTVATIYANKSMISGESAPLLAKLEEKIDGFIDPQEYLWESMSGDDYDLYVEVFINRQDLMTYIAQLRREKATIIDKSGIIDIYKRRRAAV